MVVILVILTFAIAISIQMIIAAMKKNRIAVPAYQPKQHYKADEKQKYFHPGHSWISIDQPSLVRIGLSDFIREILGNFDSIKLPHKGSAINQGESLATIHRGKRKIVISSPLSGFIYSTYDQQLRKEQPEQWIVKLIPNKLEMEMKNFIHPSIGKIWQESLRMRLVQLFSPKFGPVLQDGGKLIENFSDTLTNEEWNKLLQEFFPFYN